MFLNLIIWVHNYFRRLFIRRELGCYQDFTEITDTPDELANNMKKIKAGDYYVILHTPEGMTKYKRFIATLVNEKTGKTVFSATDQADLLMAVRLAVDSGAFSLTILEKIMSKLDQKIDVEQAIASIEDMLEHIRKGRE